MPSGFDTCLKCSSRYTKSFVSLEVYESSTEGMFAQMGIIQDNGLWPWRSTARSSIFGWFREPIFREGKSRLASICNDIALVNGKQNMDILKEDDIKNMSTETSSYPELPERFCDRLGW